LDVGSRRTLTLVGAVVVAALAGLVLLKYVNGVEQRAAQADALVDVAVAAGPIPAGISSDAAIDAGRIAMAKRPQQDVPQNAVRRLADIQGQQAALDLGGGEILTTAMFEADTVAESSNTNEITAGHVAVSVQLDEAASLGGLIEVGDKVNVFALVDCAAAGGDALAAPAGACGINASGGTPLSSRPARALFQSVKVIAVGDRFGQPVAAAQPGDAAQADPGETTVPPGNERLFTFELVPAEAALLLSIPPGNLYLTLNPVGYEPAPIPFITDIPSLPGEAGVSSDSDEVPSGTGGQ
jgi:Flp pilus assembly protein CpaB